MIGKKSFYIKVLIWCVWFGMVVVSFGYATKCFGQGVVWHKVNEATIAWDEVTTLVDGSAVPQDDIIKYRVFIEEFESPGEKIFLGEVEALTFLVAIPKEGRWLCGVSAVRYRASDGEIELLGESIINWSNNPELNPAGTWGLVFFFNPNSPENIRKEGGD